MNLKNYKTTEKTIALAQVQRYMEVTNVDMMNPREASEYNRPDLVESIRDFGLNEPIWVVESPTETLDIGGKKLKRYTPLRGFSRREALQTLVEMYPDGYTTTEKVLTKDGKEETVTTTRRFDTVAVRIIDTTDPMTMVMLNIDHGERRGLTRLGTFNAFEKLHRLQVTEKDMVTKLRGCIEANYPPDKKLPDVPSMMDDKGNPKSADVFKKEMDKYSNALLKHYKGVIQIFKLMADAPSVLKAVCLKKLAGEKKWPTNDELREGMKIYEEERQKEPTFTNPENPGPGFQQWFGELSKVKEEAEKSGTIRGKTTSQMNAAQVRELEKQLTSPLLKRLIHLIQRKVSVTNLAILDKIAKSHVLTDEDVAILRGMKPPADSEAAAEVEETADVKEEVEAEALPV